MKKNYFVLALMFASATAFGQLQIERPVNLIKPTSVPAVPFDDSRGVTKQWLAYDTADAHLSNKAQTYYIWRMNMRYSSADASPQKVVVRFDSLYDVITNTVIDRNTVTSITVDSLYANLGHENNSGTRDTLITRILNLDANRYPGNTILWSDTITTTTGLSPNNNWLNDGILIRRPNYSANMKGFAVSIEYYGAKTDTCGIIAGFNDKGGDCPNLSKFYPNSYIRWSDLASQYPLLPTPDTSDFYVDCNNSGKLDAGDGGYYTQNIRIGAWVTITTGTVGVQELKTTGIGLGQNVPNPARNSSEISYKLINDAKEVTLSVYDVIGNKVAEVREGNRPAGSYKIVLNTSTLAKGIYLYTLRADGSQSTRRMIVE